SRLPDIFSVTGGLALNCASVHATPRTTRNKGHEQPAIAAQHPAQIPPAENYQLRATPPVRLRIPRAGTPRQREAVTAGRQPFHLCLRCCDSADRAQVTEGHPPARIG